MLVGIGGELCTLAGLVIFELDAAHILKVCGGCC